MKNSKGLFVKNPNRWRVPRKLKKKIPKDTVYCYTYNGKHGEDWNDEYKTHLPWYGVNYCPFATNIKIKDMKPIPKWADEDYLKEFGEESIEWCKLVKYEIEDSCKSCGLKYGK